MADGLTITIDEEQAEQLRAAAEARGMKVEDFVRATLQLGLLQDDNDLAEDIRRWEEFERTGEAIDGDEVVAWLQSLKTDNPLPIPKAQKLK
jgi:predicted transcriptional regulator